MKTRTVSALIFLLLVITCADAQELNPQLTKVSDALECLRQHDLSQWKRERVEPFTGGKDVLIEFWSLWGRHIKLSFVPYPTDALATKEIRETAASEKAKRIEGIGDEAYAWGYSEVITLRKSNLLVSVHTSSTVQPILSGLEQSELTAYEREDQRKVNKSFAKILSQLLADLSAACKVGRPDLYKRF
jgi:hypothetical protein